ncbi:uncharacterized protein LOC132178149 [Corylus avellana]|uniref:uncharacterized protein LOC132178149 n=1 Tax=Corylus avellana TaxID=13451 RepID=UPI002869F44F|nr:uncharacterized protein LOC132178149 [Corylus avellana]
MAVKLDMSKAYDRVEWNFLEAVMYKMGFARDWVKLIMMCVRTANYSVLINGNLVGKIWPTRGIRQGDPISPYLFLLCAEALSSQLRRADDEGVLIVNSGDPVKEDLIWQIGNGNNVRIWRDKWLPIPSTYKIQSPSAVLNEEARVSELLEQDLQWWNISLLKQIFNEEEIQDGLRINETEREGTKVWKQPLEGWVKVNCNAALDITRGCFGMGIVVRDHEGKVRVAQCLYRRGTVVPAVAKAMASFYAVKLCKEKGFHKVCLEGDAKVVNSKTPNNNRVGLLIVDIRAELLALSRWQCSHICREANTAAHILAKDDLNCAKDRIWEGVIPASIKLIINHEMVALRG